MEQKEKQYKYLIWVVYETNPLCSGFSSELEVKGSDTRRQGFKDATEVWLGSHGNLIFSSI